MTRHTICYARTFLGADKDLAVRVDGDTCNATWVDSPPRGSWIVDVNIRQSNCVMSLARLAGRTITFPQQAYVNAYANVGVEKQDVPWMKGMPVTRVQNTLHELTREIVSLLESQDRDYYEHVFEPSRRLLGDLKPAAIDIDSLRSHVDIDGNQSALETFTPTAGFAPVPIYDQFKRTGRLAVQQGANILTLKRTHRDILTSRWDGGRVLSIDYKTLEARIAAIEAGIKPPIDVYDDVAKSIGGISRNVAKKAVLATLYGAGEAALYADVDPASAGWLIDKIRSHFKVDDITDRLLLERERNGGFIRSHMGRRVSCTNTRHIVYNSYVQSMGVDVAMMGFVKATGKMRDMGLLSVPLFILHDALVIDMHPNDIEYVDEITEVMTNVEGYDEKFYVKCEDFCDG